MGLLDFFQLKLVKDTHQQFDECSVKQSVSGKTLQVCISLGFLELIFDLWGFFKFSPLSCFAFLPFLSSHQKFWAATAASLCSDAVEA